MLLLGVLQAQAAGQVAGSFDLLETQVLASSAASVTFSSLSSYAADYQHLQIRYVGRTTTAPVGGTFEQLRLRFNGDTGSNYAFHLLFGTGSAVESIAATSQTGIAQMLMSSSGAAANVFGHGVIDILDPFSTTKNKTVRALNGKTESGAAQVRLTSGVFLSTASATSITLDSANASPLATGSRFSLYGIKAA